MPSCSVHHCVLFLLTLTFTTDPGSAVEFPIYAKLHQPVTLPCKHQCSGWAKWSLDYTRDVIFARCDQTSCRSLKQGYEMSHDQYKRGDLSLTITNPDYSMRKTYTCECDRADYAVVLLRISTVFSAVQMKPGEDLKLDLTVPEPVEVIYRGSDSADGVQICSLNRALECNTEYTPRTSLSNSELTLRNMKRRESGTYTIRNLDYKEDIRVYAVSVSAVSSAVQVQTEGDLKLVLSVPESVEVIYRRSDSADDVQICTVTNRTLQCNTEYTPRTSLSNSELTLRNMKRRESGTYTIRNLENNRDIRVYAVSVSGLTRGETAGIVILVLLLVLLIAGLLYYMWRKDEPKHRQVKPLKEEIQKLIKEGKVRDTPGLVTEANLIGINSDLKNVMVKVEEVEVLRVEAVKEINDLEEKHRGDRTYSQYVTWFCDGKRRRLGLRANSAGDIRTLSPESETEQFKLELEKVNKAVEKVMEPLEKARKAIDDLEEKYSEDDTNTEYVTWFCNDKRRELGLWKDKTEDSVPAWGVSMKNQNPQSVAVNMETPETQKNADRGEREPFV